MNRTIFLFFLCFFSTAVIYAQEPTAILKTAQKNGAAVKLVLRVHNPGDVNIDWGNGNKATYTIQKESTEIAGTLQGESIKIFGQDLSYLGCPGIQLVDIDVTNAVKLQQLYCDKNNLESLNVSRNTALVRLGVHTNQLKGLDLSVNKKLTGLYIQNNKLDACALNSIYNQLPKRTQIPDNVNLRVTGNPGAGTSNTDIVTAKKWSIDSNGDATGCK